MIAQVLVNGLVSSFYIALLAIGLTLVFGILRIVNYWHGEAYMLGAFIMFYAYVQFELNYWFAAIVAVVLVGLFGWFMDKALFKRFHGNLLGGAIAAIAISMGIQNSAWLLFGFEPRSIPPILTGSLEVFGATVTYQRLLVIVVSTIVVLGFAWIVRYTKLGMSMRAVQQNSTAASTLGINVNHVSAITFGIATALAALAGVLMAPLYVVEPIMGITPLMLSFIVIILGGMGSVMGAFIASFIIGFQQSFTATYLGPQLAVTISFALAYLILLIRPKGLLGK